MFYTVKFRNSGKWKHTKVFEADTLEKALDAARVYRDRNGYKDCRYICASEHVYGYDVIKADDMR